MTKWLAAAAAFACLVHSSSAPAQTYPNRNVTIVVTSAAGALTDVLTRAVAQRLSQKWNQTVIVENRGGGGHAFAAAAVKSAERDGHTLLASETGFATIQPHLYAKGKLPFDAETDFVPVAGYASIPIGLLVHPSVAKSLPELIAIAKAEARCADLWHRGRRHRAAHGRAAAGKSRRHQAHRGALSRRRSRAQRPDRGAHQHRHHGSVGRAARRQGRQDQHAGLRQPQARPAVPRRADHRRNGSRLRRERVVRPVRADGHAARRPRQDQRRRAGRSSTNRSFARNSSSRWWCSRLPGSLEAFAEYLRKDSAKWSKVIKAANLKID